MPYPDLPTAKLLLIESLRRDTADPLEELLAHRVGRLWLQGRYFDVQFDAAMRRTTREQEFLAKRQRATRQAYAAAIQALRDCQGRCSTPVRAAGRQ